MFFSYSLAQPPALQRLSSGLLQTVPIDLPVGVMMHDFAITEHYTLFMDLPLTFRLERMQRESHLYCLSRPSRFGLLPGTKITVISAGSRHRLATSSIP